MVKVKDFTKGPITVMAPVTLSSEKQTVLGVGD